MIAAPPGLTARYKYDSEDGEPYTTHHRVIAFDDDGQALVVDGSGALVLARRWDDTYDGITDHVGGDAITAIMPAGGWVIRQGADGDSWPLIGWGIRGGIVVPLTTDGDGLVVEFEAGGGDYLSHEP